MNVTFQGDTPHVVRGVQTDYRRLFYSNEDYAMTVPITLMAGYGVLPQGLLLAINLSAAGKVGYHLPYAPTSFDATREVDPARAYLTADSSTNSYVYVTMADSYKFNVGDDVVVNSSGQSAQNVGAITAIDRTTYPHIAKITFTSACSNDMTVAHTAYLIVESGDSSNNYSDAVGILMKAVDTGTGANAQGAVAQMIVSNALLYEAMLYNLDAAAKTDISGSTVGGQYLLLK